MQPHYFPWCGYLNLMHKSDIFVFLDDAQFTKASWQNRNCILINGEKKWISVPTKKSSQNTEISKKIIHNFETFKKLQFKTIFQNYNNHSNFKDIEELMNFFLTIKTDILSEFNISILKFVSKKLNFDIKFFNSSDFKIKKKEQKRF